MPDFFRIEPAPKTGNALLDRWLSLLFDFVNRLAPAVGADIGDASATLTWSRSAATQVAKTPLTAPRTLTLSASYAVNGSEFYVVRTAAATGASGLDVGGLKSIAAGQWCVVAHDGSAWFLKAFGSL